MKAEQLKKRQAERKTYTGFDFMPASAHGLANSMVASKLLNPLGSRQVKGVDRIAGNVIIKSEESISYRNNASQKVLGILSESPDVVALPNPMTNPKTYEQKGLRYLMISAPHMGYKSTKARRGDIHVVADSGGFQILMGVTDFVDPDTLVEFYNNTVDIGVGLDVPMPYTLYDSFLTRMARITCMNNTYIRSKIAPGIGIYDVAHGQNLEERKLYLQETLKHDHGEGIAMAGTSSLVRGKRSVIEHIVNGILSITYTLDKVRDRYNTAHVLGTTTPLFIFIYNLIVKSGYFKHLTADSSSYIQTSITGVFHQTIYEGKLLFNNQLYKDGIPHKLTCQCPFCLVLGDTEKLNLSGSFVVYHGLFYYIDMVKTVETLTQNYVDGTSDLKEVYRYVGNNNIPFQKFKAIVAMLEDILSIGFNKAYSKHKAFIESTQTSKVRTKNLFGKTTKQAVDPELYKRYDAILTSYENFHKERK